MVGVRDVNHSLLKFVEAVKYAWNVEKVLAD
jgi:hypothetical protein